MDGDSADPPIFSMLAIDDVAWEDGDLHGGTIPILIGIGRDNHRTYNESICLSNNNIARGYKQCLVQ